MWICLFAIIVHSSIVISFPLGAMIVIHADHFKSPESLMGAITHNLN
jgi:hypothetical protein